MLAVNPPVTVRLPSSSICPQSGSCGQRKAVRIRADAVVIEPRHRRWEKSTDMKGTSTRLY